MKLRGLSVYTAAAAPGHVRPTSVAQVGERHRGGVSGGNLRATVFGINDGLVSNAALVLGVAGAGVVDMRFTGSAFGSDETAGLKPSADFRRGNWPVLQASTFPRPSASRSR